MMGWELGVGGCTGGYTTRDHEDARFTLDMNHKKAQVRWYHFIQNKGGIKKVVH